VAVYRCLVIVFSILVSFLFVILAVIFLDLYRESTEWAVLWQWIADSMLRPLDG
jgi:hypothetical protein